MNSKIQYRLVEKFNTGLKKKNRNAQLPSDQGRVASCRKKKTTES